MTYLLLHIFLIFTQWDHFADFVPFPKSMNPFQNITLPICKLPKLYISYKYCIIIPIG